MALDSRLASRFFLPPDRAVELRAFTHGLMPRTVPDLMARFTDDWRRLGVDAWNQIPNHWTDPDDEPVGWWNLPEWLADRFLSPLLHAPLNSCILLPNVHWVVQCLLTSPEPFKEKGTILLTESEFPSVRHSVARWAPRLGLEAVEIPARPDGSLDLPSLLDAVSDDTALVFLSHVGFTSGELLPAETIQEVARRVHLHGGLLAVDGYHATASVPVDVQAWDVDLYFGGLLKEACGSSGNAFCYVRPGLELTPTLGGWFSDADPFAFGPFPTPHPQVRRRFLGGTTAVAPLYHAVEGLRILLEVGIEAVRQDSLEKTTRCIEWADRLGLPIRSPRDPSRRGAMVILDVPGAERISALLKARGIFTDSRKDHLLRLAPFVWNSLEEVDRAFFELERFVRGEVPTATAQPNGTPHVP